MKEFKDVRGSKESAKELIIGKDTVYIHKNIRKLEDDDLMKDADMYVYDEIQMTKDEYLKDLQEKLDIANTAMADMMMILGGME